METRINPITARFASQETEAAYQAFIFEGDWRNNVYVMTAGLLISTLYVALDAVTLDQWGEAAAIRLTSVAVGLAVLLAAQLSGARFLREAVPLTMAVVVGTGINAIIFLYTDLEHAYYVGLVQACVFICFLLRMSFIRTLAAMMSILAVFAAVASLKGGGEANLQIVVLSTMTGVCAIGSYLLQKFRRFDFQKTLIIEEQNKRLKTLLEDAQLDNERKLAAMNLLVHFVKTPLHQINGFSDIVLSSLNSEDGQAAHKEGVEGARYIKNATANLSKSVNSLLTYHRLDEAERRRQYEKIDIDAAFADLCDMVSADMEAKVEGKAGALLTVPTAIKTVIDCLADYYNESLNGATKLKLTLSKADGAARIVLADNGKTITREEFLDKTKPLTKIDSYLTSAGSQMPMLLRTVARAVELCGGTFGHAPLAAGNEFVITLREARAAAVMADAIAAA